MSDKLPVLHAQTHEFPTADCLIRIGIEIVRNVEALSEATPPEATPSEIPVRENLTIREAILELQQGRSIRRYDWAPKKHVSLANNGTWLFRQDGKRYMPTTEDILADDWETI